MMQNASMDHHQPLLLTTEHQPVRLRHDWLHDTIGQEYAHVSIHKDKRTPLFNEMKIYPWQDLRLSVIRSNDIGLHRRAGECDKISQDAYFAVLLLSGQYRLEQNGREVFLQPGGMTLYDATRPHRIDCPGPFSQVIVSIPRPLLRNSLAGAEHCTARHIPGQVGVSAIGAGFLQSVVRYADQLSQQQFTRLAPQALELLVDSIASVRPDNIKIGRNRAASLHRVKQFIEAHLHEHPLDAPLIAAATGFSARYINSLFTDEGTSLMRHVWQRRLEKCRQALRNPAQHGQGIAQIAYHWGFNDQAHFSRSFKQAFGISPRDYQRQQVSSTLITDR